LWRFRTMPTAVIHEEQTLGPNAAEHSRRNHTGIVRREWDAGQTANEE
jgi:hypothetical protein